MRSSLLSFSLLSFLLSAPAFAHGDHAPPPKVADCKAKECTKDEILDGVAKTLLPSLIQAKSLDTSWQGLKPAKAEQKEFKGGKEWVVTTINEKATDKAKQTLFVFVTPDGILSGVNFSGQ